MNRHISALYCLDAEGDMTTINDWRREKRPPKVHLGRTSNHMQWCFRDDVPNVTRHKIAAVFKSITPELEVPLQKISILLGGAETVWTGPAYLVTRTDNRVSPNIRTPNVDELEQFLPDWQDDVNKESPMLSWVEGGRAVGICSSVRLTSHAAEAGVDVAPEFRKRGLGLKLVAAWAEAVRELGLLPLYSTSDTNMVSQALAARLGMHRYGQDIHFS